ncbi:hypothetical protein PspLS_02300 [Pyricularia sp. CBS 133598]|nr:hypothetical protein PspLS_02300 [Pyricularia sp. CBS 133598]
MSVHVICKGHHSGCERLLTLGATFVELERPYPVSTVHTPYKEATRTEHRPNSRDTLERSQVYTSSITHTRPAFGFEHVPQLCSDVTMREDSSSDEVYCVVEIIRVGDIGLGSPPRGKDRKGMTIVVAERRRFVPGNKHSELVGRAAVVFLHNMLGYEFRVSGHNLLPLCVGYLMNEDTL